MDREAIRAKIRSQIRPFQGEQRYPTGWNGEMTFEEIRDALTPSLNRLMRAGVAYPERTSPPDASPAAGTSQSPKTRPASAD